MANYARRYGRFETSASLCEEALALFRETGDPNGICAGLGVLARACIQLGDVSRAERALQEGLQLARAIGSGWGQAHIVRLLGELALRQGDPGLALTYVEEGLALWERLGSPRGRVWSLLTLGQVRLAQADARQAAACFAECLLACHDAGDWLHLARSIEGLAAAATLSSDRLTDACARSAAQLLAAAATRRTLSAGPIGPVERPSRDRALAAVRARLGDDAFTLAWDEGQSMRLRQVVELGRRLSAEIATTAGGTAQPTWPAIPGLELLTPREREVLVLIGCGASNRQIAEGLVITERTVEVHARNIRERLGLATRAQMVAWAVQHDMLGAAE